MQRRWYKVAFCAFAFALSAACATTPSPAPIDPVLAAAARSECEALAVEYARTVREAGEATARFGTAHRERTRLDRLQASLREEMSASGAGRVAEIAATALGAELAAAKTKRASLEARYGDSHPRTLTAEAGVNALQAAIAAESAHSS